MCLGSPSFPRFPPFPFPISALLCSILLAKDRPSSCTIGPDFTLAVTDAKEDIYSSTTPILTRCRPLDKVALATAMVKTYSVLHSAG